MNATPLYYLPLIVLLLLAAWTDVRVRRIPNWLTLSVALSGIALACSRMGALPLNASLLGLSFGLGLGVVMFAIGAWGAGDAKLLAGMGAWLGFQPTLHVLAAALLIGMLIAIVQSASAGRLSALMRDTTVLGLELARGLRTGSALAAATAPDEQAHERESEQIKARTLPLAVPLLLATAGALVKRQLEG